MMSRAADLLRDVLAGAEFLVWDDGQMVPAPLVDSADYRLALARAELASGTSEAIISGESRLGGRRIAIICSEFGYMGGSIGATAADRIVKAVDRATRERLPLVALTASGGTRMREGTPAFLRMIAITSAIVRHKEAGLPYLVYLGNPTFGGVLASWASLAQVSVGAPRAKIGFVGPKVYQALHGEPFPAGVQVAEFLHSHGVLDAVLGPKDFGAFVARVLDIGWPRDSAATPGEDHIERPGHTELAGPGTPELHQAWDSVLRTRRPDRPGLRELLGLGGVEFVPVAGTGHGEQAMLVALARFTDMSCVLIGQDRHGELASPLGATQLRAARHGMQLAEELGLPVVTLIDTAGAELSVHAEQEGLAREVARCIERLITLRVPVLSVLLGQGGGGGALALLPADRSVASRHAWLAPLPPEGASAIMYGGPGEAAQVAESQHIGAADLAKVGAVDVVVAELPDAADEPAEFCARMAGAVKAGIAAVVASDEDPAARTALRHERMRRLGLDHPD
jgi:acyl-CoA carboxylase subunit beta